MLQTSRICGLAAAALGSAFQLAGQQPPQPAAFDGGRIAEAYYEFEMRAAGTAIGTATLTVSQADDGVEYGFEIVAEPAPGQMVMQKQRARLQRSPLRVRATNTQAAAGMMETNGSLVYDGGHVTGRVEEPTEQGVRTVEIDTTLADGVLDSDAMPAYVMALEWDRTSAYTFPVFFAARNEVSDVVLRVTSSQVVTVPAGTFDAWVVRYSGGTRESDFYVRKDDGVIVRIAQVAAQLEMVLVR